MIRQLNVWFFGECVGALIQNKGYLSFHYLCISPAGIAILHIVGLK